MSRATVRAAVTDYLSNAGITHLNSVKPFPAKYTGEMEFFDEDEPGVASGALIFLYIQSERESRIALGGAHDGRKLVEYTLVLDCFMRSQKKKSEEAGADNEAFLDSLLAAIRADRQAGHPEAILQWGEGVFPGSADLEVESYYPKLLNGGISATQTYSTVRISVLWDFNS
jgi:hypothetical protein